MDNTPIEVTVIRNYLHRTHKLTTISDTHNNNEFHYYVIYDNLGVRIGSITIIEDTISIWVRNMIDKQHRINLTDPNSIDQIDQAIATCKQRTNQ